MAQYPGKTISKNSLDRTQIRQIQTALKAIGIGSDLASSVFDVAMESAVKLFQSRNVDASGAPLKVDGTVGRFTWNALFKVQSQPLFVSVPTALAAQLLSTSISQIGARETSGQANRGPQVDAYLKASGISNPGNNPPGGYPWCQAFVYWCFVQVCTTLNRNNPSIKTAGVLKHWNDSSTLVGVKRVTKAAAQSNLSLLKPGMIFINDYGSGLGHTGIVESVFPDGRFVSVEGNSNDNGSRDGVGVFRLDRRKVTDKELRGFIDYSDA
jgi:CHAP domain/Putative peptidoglycan binding domain